MEMPEQQYPEVQHISFPDGNRALLVLSPPNAEVAEILSSLALSPFQRLFMIAGGASEMEEGLFSALTPLFLKTLTYFSREFALLLISGGTHAGIMKLVGEVAAQATQKIALLGVASYGLVSYPGKRALQETGSCAPLDSHHAHFVLVPSDEWGGETEMMYQLAQALSQDHPSVAFLVNGGAIAKKEALQNVRQGRPIIALEGSGRMADEIIRCWREKSSFLADAEQAEIVRDGRIYPFPSKGEATDLIELVKDLL